MYIELNNTLQMLKISFCYMRFCFNGILETKLNVVCYQYAPTLYFLPAGWSYEKHPKGQNLLC
jgi:hypothetical protein